MLCSRSVSLGRLAQGVRQLHGKNIIAGKLSAQVSAVPFHSYDPVADKKIPEPAFSSATPEEIALACQSAGEAFPAYRAKSAEERAAFLDQIATELENAASLGEWAHRESGLPTARIAGETARTTGQLRKFAELLREGSWVEARIDYGEGHTCDLRRMLVPIGPVGVFGAANFPLAFSTAGGDSAAALAAGCPVVVHAHTSHPATASIVGDCIVKAANATNMPPGVFSLLHGHGGLQVVTHEAIKAIAFTGSRSGGRFFMDAAAQRAVPIPVFAEMSSINPVFVLPGALRERGVSVAEGLAGSLCLGAGQFCTNPGLIFVEEGSDGDSFLEVFAAHVGKAPGQTMLSPSIRTNYVKSRKNLAAQPGVKQIAGSDADEAKTSTTGCAAVFSTSADNFLQNRALAEEVFGATALVVRYSGEEQLRRSVAALEGQLTATVHAADGEEFAAAKWLFELLSVEKAGRVLANGFPTGVEVTHAMTHGGPYPATSDGRTTSVGQEAIKRFVRATTYQDAPDAVLPVELQRANPRGILRLVNSEWTREGQ